MPFAYRFLSFHAIPKIVMAAIGGKRATIPAYSPPLDAATEAKMEPGYLMKVVGAGARTPGDAPADASYAQR